MSDKESFIFLPLGGSGEIGMNLNAFGIGQPDRRRWLIVDIGVTFSDMRTPGVDVIMPNPVFLEECQDQIEAIILTHAHEDHIGALGHLWRRLRAPVYATPFTAVIARHKLKEAGLDPDPILHEISLESEIGLGPFQIELVSLTHSIPEPNGLVIRTRLGSVFHTGDWKIDPHPQIGGGIDASKLEKLRDENLLAMLCDSTNVFSPGFSGSEADVKEELIHQIAACKGRVGVATFASNVARLKSVVNAAEKAGRRVALVGRSMERMTEAAREVDLFADAQPFLRWEEAEKLPRDKILYLCTGSQGEPRAALSRIARGDHKYVKFGAGDTIFFSSKVIPGNERDIFNLQNDLAALGVEIITEHDAPIHVSGHPNRGELAQMMEWVKPPLVIPLHGEHRHLAEHAHLAKQQAVSQAIPARNGEIIQLAPGKPGIIDEVASGRLYLDGMHLVEAENETLRERRKLAYAGHISAALSVDRSGNIVDGPLLRLRGVTLSEDGEDENIITRLEEGCEQQASRFLSKHELDFDKLEQLMELSIKKQLFRLTGKRGTAVDAIVLSAD